MTDLAEEYVDVLWYLAAIATHYKLDFGRVVEDCAGHKPKIGTSDAPKGRETEPNYIDELRDHLRINAAAIHIEPGGSVTSQLFVDAGN